jgi:hypothetical protein
MAKVTEDYQVIGAVNEALEEVEALKSQLAAVEARCEVLAGKLDETLGAKDAKASKKKGD